LLVLVLAIMRHLRKQKDIEIILFGVIYILVFTIIYTLMYYDLNAFLFILIILLIYNIPSLFSTLILLFFERRRDKAIPKYVYFTVSILFFFISFYIWNSVGNIDNKNIYPFFNNAIHIIILYSIFSHFVALFFLTMINQLKISKNGT